MEVCVLVDMNCSRCKCGHETSPEVVSNSTLHISMGIVLQLLFYDSTSLGPCGHRLFGDRVSSIQVIHSKTLFFLQGSLLTTFTFAPMDSYSITRYDYQGSFIVVIQHYGWKMSVSLCYSSNNCKHFWISRIRCSHDSLK